MFFVLTFTALVYEIGHGQLFDALARLCVVANRAWESALFGVVAFVSHFLAATSRKICWTCEVYHRGISRFNAYLTNVFQTTIYNTFAVK